ncbi:MAG: SDR family oxidoreductase [Gemmatimonadetes bacterium]|nr:SDR family oxidoreductase [Gemmatimonadota bacterium]MYG85506.1 SDR family oxidoreductase [Gemmatimonadota bacterium]MYJ91151.1 SDR family oxidoreductase [Gemmatimonadota bacterium]
MKESPGRPVALVTGVSRKIGIGAAISLALAKAGWDVATTYWRPYDAAMPWGSDDNETVKITDQIHGFSAKTISIEADLSDTASPKRLFDRVESSLGSVAALVMAHCHSVDSSIKSTTIESFDLHFTINARATWLLIREFGKRYQREYGRGRVISITSDHTAHNLPYGASKGAMDRIVLAAAQEFRDQGVTANVINPGATDTGWMSDDLKEYVLHETLLGRIGLPEDCARLVSFLCSEEGGWINGQLMYSNGGIR